MSLLQLLAFIFLFFSATFADQPATTPTEGSEFAGEDVEEEVDGIVSSPDVTAIGLFPRHPNDGKSFCIHFSIWFNADPFRTSTSNAS